MVRGIVWVILAALGISEARAIILFQGPVESAILGTNRMVRVWVPFGYGAETNRRYSVAYVNDGQNMFSIVGTNAAFGWGSWNLDLIADDLISSNMMRPTILVSVDATAARYLEYRGPANTNSTEKSNRRFDDYLRFLVEELKPRIDRQYRTLTNAVDTGIMGSSLGGICSLSAALERPDVFGAAGCLSGSFQIEREEFIEMLKRRTSLPQGLRFYLDSGRNDFTGGDDNRVRTEAVATEFRRLGWRDGREFLRIVDNSPMSHRELIGVGLRRDKIEEAKRSQHNEFYWRRRAWRSLTFMFPPEPAPAR